MRKPLDIPVVQQYLEVAILTVEKVTNTTDELFEMVMLAEKAIQYGNRYRSQYPPLIKVCMKQNNLSARFNIKKHLNKQHLLLKK